MTTDSSKPSAWFTPAALAMALVATVGASNAAAQTVLMKGLAPGATFEATLRQATASGKAGVDGIATATLSVVDAAPTAELVVIVHVDACGPAWRVVLVERSIEAPAPSPGCTRREIPGAFVVRRITSLAIDVAGTSPTLLIRQGPPSSSWLEGPAGTTAEPRSERFVAPRGLMAFGGGGVGRISDAVSLFCGNLSQCTGESTKPAFKAGAVFWLSPYIGAMAGYAKPADVTASGSGTGFRFNSSLDAENVSIAGLVGAPAFGRVRLYGHAGANYHRARFRTNQTNDPTTVTVDEAPVVFPGGTQTFEFETSGWGWIFGGGAEIWVTTPLAIYAEIEFAGLKGDDRNGGEPTINDKMTLLVAGVRFRLGRGR